MEPEQMKGHIQRKPEANVDRALNKLGSSRDATSRTPHSRTSSADLKIKTQNSSLESSPMMSPPRQTMGESLGYDPNRIPLSVFSIKSTNPAEWSCASNESLFSIQMGNNSFSRDYAILFGKSGELGKLDDWNRSSSSAFWMSGELPRLDEWDNAQSSDQAKPNDSRLPNKLPPSVEASPHKETSSVSEKVSRVASSDNRKSPKVAPYASVENNAKDKPVIKQSVHSPKAAAKMPVAKNTSPSETTRSPLAFPSPPRYSAESGNSGSSFVFPVLVNDGGKGGGSSKAVAEKPPEPQPKPQPQLQSAPQSPPESHPKTNVEPPKPPNTRRCAFLWCFPKCC